MIKGKVSSQRTHLFVWRYAERSSVLAKREDIEAKATEVILPFVEAQECELIDLEYVKEGSDKYLRAYIDKAGGVTVNDCEAVSRPFSDKLDELDFIDEAYILEVSSPGLGRPFKKDKDFARNIDEEVECKLYSAVNHKKDFTGLLKAFDANTITLELEDGQMVTIDRKNLALIRQTVYF